MDIRQTLSKRIFDLSIQHHKTFYELSKLSGLPKSTLRDIARGTSKNPRIENIEKIAKAFGISLYDFFDDELFKS